MKINHLKNCYVHLTDPINTFNEKKSKRLWLKIHPMDESEHWDFFHNIPTYVRLVLDD